MAAFLFYDFPKIAEDSEDDPKLFWWCKNEFKNTLLALSIPLTII